MIPVSSSVVPVSFLGRFWSPNILPPAIEKMTCIWIRGITLLAGASDKLLNIASDAMIASIPVRV